MNTFSRVPPGFRFHPTDEELVDYYLRKKVTSRRIDLDVIKDVDLYKIEPWDLQELCRLGTDEQNEWYFFSHKDKKYPTGTRTNRATAAGFWKATGRDKAIYAKHDLIGMRKTLVFYKGRAPNGQKSDWIMHEYRLETEENGAPQEEGWVVCRVFKKRLTTIRKASDHESPCWYDDQSTLFMPALDSPKQNPNPNHLFHNHHFPYACKKELDHHHQLPFNIPNQQQFLQLPLLDTPSAAILSCNSMSGFSVNPNHVPNADSLQLQSLIFGSNNNSSCSNNNGDEQASEDHQVTDWRVLDKLVASQLSQVEVPNKENSTFTRTTPNMFQLGGDQTSDLAGGQLNKEEMMPESDSMPSGCQMELWK